MTFVTRSRPFCRPKLQTRKPATTTTSVQNAISPGVREHLAEDARDLVRAHAGMERAGEELARSSSTIQPETVV